MPVGAVGALLVALTARTSWRVGAGAALGVATADGLYATVAMAGGAALAPVIRPLAGVLRWGAVVVLFALALHAARTAVRHYRERALAQRETRTPTGPGRAYLGFLGITLLNPMTVVYFAALVLAGEGGAVPDRVAKTLFVVAAFAASASWQLFLAGGGAILGRVLTGPQGRLWTSLVSSAVIIALAVRLALG
ncbi:lysine transporter LysE [Streptacidiphilus pinicola]|uniref:Lysine transporter LysE n=1 Tax=Streptacidiphilus pinicola TaxID=2219663 RepID=A0A2X0K8D5_9ACTN|nr:LysE family transporter [Streptacidiphilus pinicola]RAG83460.1 lysine transporter LysE [Streptacidiphilus pinicola]